ncbi:Outer membrane receptor proteins, mostly Fe transport [Pseudidiomarina planktonica]|uniref:Outer membrane receptor proteins, mostly Fe transport n=1 Tax=Pseudidiomarina planktonica TaxID=1323738 RepID=A0A1Y6G3G9_9GAMM|nr:Outer membrane receptor proteins, mostly Fe transport [Pseudidiomarina planktonica]
MPFKRRPRVTPVNYLKVNTLILLATPAFVMAQSTTADVKTASAEQRDVEVIQVFGDRKRALTSPKDAQLSGLFGGDKSIFEIPRAVTPITSAMMEDNAIDDLHDILKLAPNTYAASGFGAPSLPTIRGQLGELFEAGMRRQAGNNGFGIPLSFNGVEQIDVVKGVPSVILGSTQRVGGFVNLQPKQAPLTGSEASMKVSAGRWDSYTAQVDAGTAVEEGKQGVRVSAEVRRQGSFYDYAHFDSENLMLAYRLRPNSKSEWRLNFEFFDVDYTDNAGINRPTQNLIDHNLYITGQGVQPNGSTVPGPFSVVSPTGEVEIPRSQVLTDPLTTNNAQTYLVHSVYQLELNDSLALTNRTYFQHLQRDEVATNSFVEIIDGASTFENRLELQKFWSETQQSTFGFNVRYNDVLGYSQFTTEADLPTDLTGPLSNRRIPLTAEQQARLVELRPGVYVSPGAQYDNNGDGVGDYSLSDTTDSESLQLGVFWQQESQLTERLLLTLGGRLDYYDVTARDALPPEGFAAAEDSISEVLGSAAASLNYRLQDSVLLYGTVSYLESTSNSMGGGNVLGANNQISELNFATENELVELGIKYAPATSPWYADAAIFNQTRSLRNRDGSNSGIKTRGFETQVVYDGLDGWWVSAGYSYLDARYDNSASFQDSAQVADAFDDSRPDIIEGTGVGAPNFAGFAPSSVRVQGLPDHSASFAVGYELSEQWSLGLDAIYTGNYKLDYLNTVRIRDQHTLNANVQYSFANQRSTLRLDVFNLTDQDNWSPVFEGGYFGSTLAFPSLPRYLELTFKHTF